MMTGALMWSAEQGTDGRIPIRSLRLLHPEGTDPKAVAELVQAQFWERNTDHVQVLNWAQTQSLAVDVEWQRERNRVKNKALREREREKARGARQPAFKQETVTGHETGDVTDHAVGKASARTGQERSGSVDEEERPVPQPRDDVEDRTDSRTGEVFDQPFGLVREGQKVRWIPRTA
ncbi:hypothetical protein C5B93_15895 [Rathayibacter sp. AY1A2]|nr:hypothetical protein [Rathayibacter sp. AY1A2]PPF32275.1 hypothetical protein C5B93_15895 [Rathayibacter sp. AY1A2]PPH26851.1 hypothetical protein C5C94_16320 [Rathayibacter sp. AY1C3]